MNDEATVFLVDDDPAALRALATLVKVVFPRVATFSSAAEFLAAYHHQPGCLVLDVAMPGMSGLELHRKLIHDKIALPVVFVTGHGNVPMAVEAMQMGAVNFLEKPVQEQELWDSIRQALELDAQNRRRQRPPPARRGAARPTHRRRTRSAQLDPRRKDEQGDRHRARPEHPHRRGPPREADEEDGRQVAGRTGATGDDALE